jgi:hypothetical protein
VHDDAYDNAYDDRDDCTGSFGAGGSASVHVVAGFIEE